ncbi:MULTISPECIES: transposase [unclassified Pseudonocardia]|uniref:transposase n=1 Tax=unclassified Pseudonocardia TaxID=2619320 RepID=UPI002101A53F|nr:MULTISPECIES: transposase [unclassified Pseudonocardia]
MDEFGPLNLQPRPDRGWFPSGHPARLLATYNRYGGVRRMIAGLDLASGQLFYRLKDCKRSQEFLAFLRQLRVRFPRGRLYVVCDNFSPHRKVTVADWCADHDVELVFTPTYASWLNWIESEFTALRYFTLDGSDYPPTPPRSPRSPATSAGPTDTPPGNDTSRPSPRSAGRITHRTSPDEALETATHRVSPATTTGRFPAELVTSISITIQAVPSAPACSTAESMSRCAS